MTAAAVSSHVVSRARSSMGARLARSIRLRRNAERPAFEGQRASSRRLTAAASSTLAAWLGAVVVPIDQARNPTGAQLIYGPLRWRDIREPVPTDDRQSLDPSP